MLLYVRKYTQTYVCAYEHTSFHMLTGGFPSRLCEGVGSRAFADCVRASSTATLSGMKSAAGEAYIMASCSLGMSAALTQQVGSTACAESVTLVICYSLGKQIYIHKTTKPVRILSFFHNIACYIGSVSECGQI